jgi:hypothetical protein
MQPADPSFIEAMRLMSEAAMQRRSAAHFRGEDRAELEAKADDLRVDAYDKAVLGVEALARR